MNTKIITFSILAVLFMTIAGAISEIAPCFVLIIASVLACVFAAAVFIIIFCNEMRTVYEKRVQAKACLEGQVAGLNTEISTLQKSVEDLKQKKENLKNEVEELKKEGCKILGDKNKELIAQLDALTKMGERLSNVEKKLEELSRK